MNIDIKKNISKNIMELRKERKLTQSELGEKLCFSDKTVSKWEKGDSTPDIEALASICDFFNITIDDLTKENAITKSSDIINKKQRELFFNRLSIIILSVISVFFAATIVFIASKIIYKSNYFWQAFVLAVPLSSFILHRYFKKDLNNKILSMIFISLTLWSTLTSVFLILLKYCLWQLFLLGVPIQAIIVVSELLHTKIN